VKNLLLLFILSLIAVSCASTKSNKQNKKEVTKTGQQVIYEGIGRYR